MTVAEAMARVRRERPGEATDSELRAWLNQLDGRFYREVVMRHEGYDTVEEPSYLSEEDDGKMLLIPCPYDEVYMHHLYACVDMRLGEMDRYNNDAALFADGWRDACRAWKRAHMPMGARINHVVYGKVPVNREEWI